MYREQGCRSWGCRGATMAAHAWQPQILSDQLTLYQVLTRGADYAHHITNAPLTPPDFQTFLRPYKERKSPSQAANSATCQTHGPVMTGNSVSEQEVV